MRISEYANVRMYFIVSLMSSFMVSVALGGVYGGGSGIAEDPYLINSPAHLIELATFPPLVWPPDLDKHFVLTANIDLQGQTIGPIGVGFDDPNNGWPPFTGVFDGNGFTVSGFRPSFCPLGVGFFGCVGGGAEIRNLRLVNVSIDATGCYQSSIGGLVGYNKGGTIANCYVVGEIGLTFVYDSNIPVGGLVGYNSGTITSCDFAGNVSCIITWPEGQMCAGGLVGINTGTLFGCHVSGSVYAPSCNHVGGLVGWNYTDGNIMNCNFLGAVSGTSNIGGLVGYNGVGTVTDCCAIADVSGTERVGGIIGGNGDETIPGSSIKNCNSAGEVSGKESVGGLIGWTREGTILNCYSACEIFGFDDPDYGCGQFIGGLIGKNGEGENIIPLPRPGGRIENCYATGNIICKGQGLVAVGGLVGHSAGNEVINCFATGNVDAGVNGGAAGGLIGVNIAVLTNCHSSGKVSGRGNVGGLIGSNGISQSWVPAITNCYATGDVITQYSHAGGLIGYNYGNIRKCYATGSVIGVSGPLGGLVGQHGNNHRGIVIEESFATGNVSCTNCMNGYGGIGGFVGFNSVGAIVNSYTVGNVSSDSNIVGGLVGGNWRGDIVNSYSIGMVLGDANVGGAVGDDYQGTIYNVFWDVNTSGLMISAGGTGKTTAEMQQQPTFTGWDFETVWSIDEGIDYPQLLWQQSQPPEPVPGDITSDGKVDFADFAIIAEHWLENI